MGGCASVLRFSGIEKGGGGEQEERSNRTKMSKENKERRRDDWLLGVTNRSVRRSGHGMQPLAIPTSLFFLLPALLLSVSSQPVRARSMLSIRIRSYDK